MTKSMKGAWIAVSAAGFSAMIVSGVGAQERKEAKMPPAVRERVGAIEKFVEARDDASITKFIDQQLAPAARDAKGKENWMAELKEIRRKCTSAGSVLVAKTGEWSFVVRFGKDGVEVPVEVELESTPPNLIAAMKLGNAPAENARTNPAGDDKTPPLTWENLRERLKAEEADGFAGSVLVVRKGEVFLHEGYGQADREKKIANRPETVFAIGSTPIDFTKVSILKLEDMGKLKTSDPISKYLPNVPADKQAITIEHLMTGKSGLRNFHGRPTDADQDNSWIDRETAVKRILEDDLLFAPGTDRAHSHSAFGLLAAIVEMVSGESIGAFYRRHLFEPAGMTRTSLYEEIKTPQDEIAIGYGGAAYSAINSPNHWGKTSWLVMGSGGMVSSSGDLYRFNKALRGGKILSPETAKKYWSPGGGLGVGASDNGFFTALTEGPDNMMFLCSNIIGRARTERLIRDLAGLCR